MFENEETSTVLEADCWDHEERVRGEIEDGMWQSIYPRANPDDVLEGGCNPTPPDIEWLARALLKCMEPGRVVSTDHRQQLVALMNKELKQADQSTAS